MAESKAKSQPPNSEQENKLTSAQFDEFKEALELLYVIANLSARIQFAKNWPAAADFVLGDDLMEYDREGVKSHEEKEDRAGLEQQAEGKRIALLEFLDTVEEKSVDKGALQIEYVKEAMGKLGRDLSLLVYGEHLVDRFLPVSPDEAKKKEEGKAEEGSAGAPAPAAPTEMMAEPKSDLLPPETPAVSPTAGTASSENPDGPTDVNPETLSPSVADAMGGGADGALKIHHDPLDDVKPIDLQPPSPPEVPQPDQPATAVEPSLPPEDIPAPETPPETVPKGDVIQPLEAEAPHLAEEDAHNPIDTEQARAEDDDPTIPLMPEGPPTLQAPPPLASPPEQPAPDVDPPQAQPPSAHTPPPPGQATPPPPPAGQTEPSPPPVSPPPQPAQAPSQSESGEMTQKPVAMKFVSSKDKKSEEPSGEGEKKDENDQS